ncbi:putative tail protein [Rhizobium phage RHph_Y3_56_1]|nr:putative tail protein [Rhizobium phage RHph_Y3_1]QIG77987.1 putative tail protein [Rhizobium phage RHph_Y3_56_1]
MASAELELQGALVGRLKADAPLTALVQGRVYDQPPSPVTYPYVTIGEAQTIRDDATCVSGGQVYLTLHAWSTKPGFPEVKQIADAVVESLHLAPIALPTNRLISIMHRQTRTFRDADGLTSHAVIEFVANTEKP